MGKKRRKPRPGGIPSPGVRAPISAGGWRTIACGAGALAAGFCLLTWTDPMGRNWASALAPLGILGGCALMAVGILRPENAGPVVPGGREDRDDGGRGHDEAQS